MKNCCNSLAPNVAVPEMMRESKVAPRHKSRKAGFFSCESERPPYTFKTTGKCELRLARSHTYPKTKGVWEVMTCDGMKPK